MCSPKWLQNLENDSIDKWKLKAFEMWNYWKMLKNYWTDKVTRKYRTECKKIENFSIVLMTEGIKS